MPGSRHLEYSSSIGLRSGCGSSQPGVAAPVTLNAWSTSRTSAFIHDGSPAVLGSITSASSAGRQGARNGFVVGWPLRRGANIRSTSFYAALRATCREAEVVNCGPNRCTFRVRGGAITSAGEAAKPLECLSVTRRNGVDGLATNTAKGAATLCVAAALAGCSGTSGGFTDVPSAVLSWAPGVPDDLARVGVAMSPTAKGPAQVAAGWDSQPGRLRVTTWGSSGCPNLPDVVEAQDGRIEVTTVEYHPQGGGCTADASPTTSVARVPPGVDTPSRVTVVIDGTALVITKAQ